MQVRAKYYCSFCGREKSECPNSQLWGAPELYALICLYCLRAGIRAFGEVPDPTPSVVPFPSRSQRMYDELPTHEPEPAA